MELLRRARYARLCTAAATFFLLSGVAGRVVAADLPSEQQIEAAYLFNFARYVDWPSSAFNGSADPLRICVLGGEDFIGVARSSVGDRKVDERPVIIEGRDSVGESGSCHILFIGVSDASLEGEVIADLGAKNVFTVSDTEGFAKRGGVANFVRVGKKVRFEINREAASKAGLKVSSRLLRLAKVVE